MKRNLTLWLAAAALGIAAQTSAQTGPNGASGLSPNPNGPGSGNDIFVSDASLRTFTVTGTVVHQGKGQLVVAIDDHGHRIPFQLGAGVDKDIRKGSHVSVTYHPNGANGQTAEQVQVLEAPRAARRHAAEKAPRP
jgi:hypothetical protein